MNKVKWLKAPFIRASLPIILTLKHYAKLENGRKDFPPFFSNVTIVTSGAGFGTRGPALQGPLIRVLLDDVVVVDGHRIFMNDVLVHQSGPRFIVLRNNLPITKYVTGALPTSISMT